MMTCKDLIAELQKYNPDKPIVFLRFVGKNKEHIPITKVSFNKIFDEINLSYEN